jgi:hypothetical protein
MDSYPHTLGWQRSLFYSEGYRPSLVTLLEAQDAERLAVARAFGVHVPGVHEWRRTGSVAKASRTHSASHRRFRAEGRTIERLSLARKTVAEIRRCWWRSDQRRERPQNLENPVNAP